MPTLVDDKSSIIIRPGDGQFFGFFSPRYLQLSDFNHFQGTKITTEHHAMTLRSMQRKFIISALKTSVDWMTHSTPIDPKCKQALQSFHAYYRTVISGKFIQAPHAFANQQKSLYEAMHQLATSDVYKLSFEFILGLARLDLALQLLHQFIKDCYGLFKDILPQHKLDEINQEFIDSQCASFFDRLDQIGKASLQLIDAITCVITTQQTNYWRTVRDYFETHPTIKQLANHLVSMQYIPSNLSFLTMAQVLHWNGLGGNTKILEPFSAVHGLFSHAIEYHGTDQTPHFSMRMKTFRDSRKKIMDHVNCVVVNALPYLFKTSDIRLYDMCSGPSYAACADIMAALPHYQFHLTVSDIDGQSLHSALIKQHKKDHLPNITIEDIYYEDMNLSLPDIKNAPYHMIMVGIGLHQLPQDRIASIIKQLSLRLLPGGLILNPDVGSESAAQLFLIPANIVDREGSVPSYDAFNLHDLIQETEHSSTARIAYPLHRVCCSPNNTHTHQMETGPYMFNIFIALDIDKKHISSILREWKTNTGNCDAFISSICAINVCELQDNMLQNIQLSDVRRARL